MVLMWLVGRRVIPWLLHYVAHTGSRELFRLAVLAIALGVAYGAATLFDVSFALGAFFAGMILSESALSQRAAQETLPLRDAFAVLFFVSVGMLFNPARDPEPIRWRCSRRLLIIIVAKSALAYFVDAAVPPFGIDRADDRGEPRADRRVLVHPRRRSASASACCPQLGRDLILAGALISILLDAVPVRRRRLDLRASRAGAEEAGGRRPSRRSAEPRRRPASRSR